MWRWVLTTRQAHGFLRLDEDPRDNTVKRIHLHRNRTAAPAKPDTNNQSDAGSGTATGSPMNLVTSPKLSPKVLEPTAYRRDVPSPDKRMASSEPPVVVIVPNRMKSKSKLPLNGLYRYGVENVRLN